MPGATPAPENRLLAALREDDRALLYPGLRECRFLAGQVLYEPGDAMGQCYFPLGPALCSCFVRPEGEAAVETGLIGREGVIGGVTGGGSLPAFVGVVVMHGGAFLSIEARALDRARRASPVISDLFSRYAECLIAQVQQAGACNSAHTIEQRAAKWLLAATGRVGGNDVAMTQEQLAAMMGIGRSYASRVVQRFKRDGILRTRRGGVTVLDRDALRERACSCHEKVCTHFDAVLSGLYPAN
jgi:CRP-like cAMP-binding protein